VTIIDHLQALILAGISLSEFGWKRLCWHERGYSRRNRSVSIAFAFKSL